MPTKIYKPETSNLGSFQMGNEGKIHSHCWIGNDVKIGNRVKIQAFAFIPDGITIEDDVFIGPRVTFTNDPKLECRGPDGWKKTLIQKGAKIGAGVTVLAGVTIGENSIIGMGAIVLKDVPAGETWVGNPAHKI